MPGKRGRTSRRRSGPFDHTTDYAQKVTAGEIVAGKWVRLACARHLKDIEEGSKRGLVWSAATAERVFQFFRCLRFVDGEHAGKAFDLSPHQKFIVGSLFGWHAEDGFRRFRNAYIEEGKGNGKTPLAAGIGLYGLVADGEDGAEIYSAAVGRDQAKICFGDAKNYAGGSRALRRRLVVNENNIAYPARRSFFRPVSSEGRGLDGKRVHIALIDELHEHATPIVVEKMRAGTKGRRQALIFRITNSGYDRNSVCYKQHEYTCNILEGIFEDDSWFGFIAAVDEGDDPLKDESCWQKANPNLDVSVTRKYLREQVREAIGMPSQANIVRRLNFCMWTEQASTWIPLEQWDACGKPEVKPAELQGRECFGGLDLASTADITALVLDFPEASGAHTWLPFFWVPEATIAARVRQGDQFYETWVRNGLLLTTPGNIVDYDFIRAFINEKIAPTYRVREIAIDRLFNSIQLSTDLQSDGFTVAAHGQGFLSMAGPSKTFEEMVGACRLKHGGNPILRWMAKNVAAAQDPAGNKKPDKKRSRDKIDGIVAGIMALGRATANAPKPPSVYKERGVITL